MIPIFHSPAPDKQLCLRVVTLPENTNPNGVIFGGWTMAQLDIGGSWLAIHMAGGTRVSTVAVRDFEFLAPILVGDCFSVYGKIIRTGTTSITVALEAFSQRTPHIEQHILVARATMVYVAIHPDGQRHPLPEKYQNHTLENT